MIWWSAAFLLLGIVAYGVAGARLHTGSRDERGALRSSDWWLGTGLQGAGFLLTLLARRSLPLLIVQASSAAGLAVTAAIQHVTGARRLRTPDAAAVVVLVAGLGLIASATVPGPAVPISAPLTWFMIASTIVCGGAVFAPARAVVSGVLSGLGFSFGAVGARLLMGDELHPLWRFWELPPQSWLVGVLTGAGVVLGQVHLTRGLAVAAAAPVLGDMYLAETIVPGIVGVTMMAELPRPDSAWLVVVGLVASLGATVALVRLTAEPALHPDSTSGDVDRPAH